MNAKPDFASCDVDALFKAGYQDCHFWFLNTVLVSTKWIEFRHHHLWGVIMQHIPSSLGALTSRFIASPGATCRSMEVC